MKKHILYSLLIWFSFNAFSQTTESWKELNINNHSVGFSADGALFYDHSGEKTHQVPNGTGRGTLYAGGIWIGGYDPAKTLHVSAQTYASNGQDYWAGPIASNNNNWNKIWKVEKFQINALIDDFAADHKLDNKIPQDILTWPGKGNPNWSHSISDRDLAPFVDYNQDGIYNVYDGDYPLIKGDQNLWWIINDQKEHLETQSTPLGIEIHFYAYAFDCSKDAHAQNSFFLDVDVINQSNTSYDSVYLGVWTDMDLGNPFDDYIGCDTATNTYYTYNGSVYDDEYREKLPVQSVTFLNQDMSHFMYYTNDGGVETNTGDPRAAEEFYGYLKSYWRDGTHLTYGGSGYGGATETDFMFSSNPADVSPHSWSEVYEKHIPGDRRGIGSIGPFTFNSGTQKSLQLKYTYWANEGISPDISSLSLNQTSPPFIQHNTFQAIGNCVLDSIEFIKNTSGDIDSSYWLIDDQMINSNSFNYLFKEEGQKNIQMIDENACTSDTIQKTIHLVSSYNVDLGADTSVCEGDILTLRDINNTSQSTLWSTGDTTASILVFKSGLYSLETGTGTCKGYDDIYVEYENCIPFIPNVFSPNDDNQNETFTIFGNKIQRVKIQIYDRHGALVFRSNKKDAPGEWDGTNDRGEKLPEGSYVFTLEALLENGNTITKSGNITLVR